MIASGIADAGGIEDGLDRSILSSPSVQSQEDDICVHKIRGLHDGSGLGPNHSQVTVIRGSRRNPARQQGGLLLVGQNTAKSVDGQNLMSNLPQRLCHLRPTGNGDISLGTVTTK